MPEKLAKALTTCLFVLAGIGLYWLSQAKGIVGTPYEGVIKIAIGAIFGGRWLTTKEENVGQIELPVIPSKPPAPIPPEPILSKEELSELERQSRKGSGG